MSNTDTTLAERPSTDLRVMIQSEKIREQLAMALPKYYSPEQFTVIVRTAINRNPKLAECEPGSFMTAMVTAAQMGVAPDGRNGYLIPRWNGKTQRTDCTFMPSYIGLIGLVRRNDNVADVYAEPVHEADSFTITKGLHRDLIHEVDVRKDRGAFIGAYAVIAYKDGRHSFEFMSKLEIDGIKARSQSPNAGPWATDYSEMAKKTVIKRLLKTADLSQDTADRIAIDNSIDVTPAAAVTEIKKASIPDRQQAALPEPSAEQDAAAPTEPYPEPEPQPEPEQEPKKANATTVEKPAAKGKLAKKEKPAPAKDDPKAALIARTRESLSESGYTEAQLVQVLIANEWGNWKEFEIGKTTADDFDMDILEALFEEGNWETIVAELKDLAK